MYSPSQGRHAETIESEVFYWRLLGFQAAFVYGIVSLALLTGVLSFSDEAFDATVLTVTAIFGSSLLYMPQSKQPCFDCFNGKKVRYSNAAYRFSRQWSIRRQGSRRRACSQQPYRNFIYTGCRVLVAFLYSAIAKGESWIYGDAPTEIWSERSFRGCDLSQRWFKQFRRGPRFLLRNCSGISKLESRTYRQSGTEIWRQRPFRGRPSFSQRCLRSERGPRFQFLLCRTSIRSPVLTCGTLGDVAMRGIYILTGDAAVRWHVGLFHKAPGILSFLAKLTLYCFFGAVVDTLHFAGRCSSVAQRTLVTVAMPMRRTRIFGSWAALQHIRIDKIVRKCRGSGLRNIFVCIFVLFLLGGFLLEGNPPRGLAAPPLHAGADVPQRFSTRLAQNDSDGSTYRRSIDPGGAASRSYVPRWQKVQKVQAPVGDPQVEFSMADQDSPPRSPEVEAVEAEVLEQSCDLLNTMRNLDSQDFEVWQGQSVNSEEKAQHPVAADPTVDLQTTQVYLQFSAPASDLEVEGREGPPQSDSKDCSPGTDESDAIEGGQDVIDVDDSAEPPRTSRRPTSSAARSKAKPGAKYQWVPTLRTQVSKEGGVQGVAGAWATLDSITLQEEWKFSCATVREVPEFFRRPLQEAFHVATSRIRDMHTKKKDLEQERAWKLFLLLPRMLLSRTKRRDEDGKAEFFARFRAFQRGDWLKLVEQARLPKRKKQAQRVGQGVDAQAKLRAAEQRARWGELSHARQELVGTPLAPRTMDTYYKLADPGSRPQQPRSYDRLMQICQFQPESAVELDYVKFISNVRSSPRGKSGGLSGMRNEHLKCIVFSPRLEDSKALYYVAETLARAEIPEPIRKALALARMTALDKGASKVRGIAAGDTFRRVVAKTLAQQFASEFDEACAPYQFALSTRAGTDCVGHALREISTQHPDKVVISLDGIGAYDHVDRAQMLEGLAALPNACALLPFVAMFYGHISEYYWTNDDAEVWSIEQGDGGEQGDPLMPALFAIGQHSALVSADSKVQELMNQSVTWDEQYFKPLLFAFLDDLYVVTVRDIARAAFDIVTGEVEKIAGIRTNLGKLQLYSAAGGSCPPGFADIAAHRAIESPIWTMDAPQLENRGIVVLGSPLGSVEFCKAHADKRMQIEQQLLDWIPKIPTVQISWLLLYFCAAQRANHLIRLLPPSLSIEYADKHDVAISQCLENLLQAGPLPENAKRISILRCVNGGLGLRSARRTAQAAFWAAWADALPMLHSRVPEHAYQWSEALEMAQANVAHVELLKQLPSGLQEAELARRQLVAEGYRDCPTWEDIRAGVRPQNPDIRDRAPGEWCRGWQFFASRVRDNHYLEFEVRPNLSPAGQALLLSQGGPFASQFLQALPTKPQLELENLHMHCLLRRRLRLPLVDGLCSCPAHSHGNGKNKSTEKVELDEFGDHLASCMRTGRVQRRANILEKIWMQVFEEAGGTLVPNEKLRNMRIGVDQEDKRRVEFAVYNLKFGPPLLCDVTQVSPLDQNGTPHPKCSVNAGAAFDLAEKRKENRYREAAEKAGKVKLETLASEIGGRWSENCIQWVAKLAKYKARTELPHLKRATEFAWHSRWWSILSVAAMRALALSLIEVQGDAIKSLADFEPRLGDILADVRYELGPVVSRLPLRS